MISSKKSTRIGGILFFLLLSLVVIKADDFLSQEEWGRTMLFVAMGASFLVFPSVSLTWKRPAWLKNIYMVMIFLVTPLIMMIAVERLNGNFITGFLTDEDVYENYVVYLLIYLLVFGLSGSVRISVMTVSPILLLYGIANMYVKEFKGSPLVPMDFGSIRTAGNVAAAYTYEVGYEIVLGVCLTAMLMALVCHLKMPKAKLPAKLAVRLLSLLVVGGFAYTFYFTDTVADYGLKPDFFNQTRGYKNHGAVLSFTLNTKYLWLTEPSGYDASEIENIVEENLSDTTPNILETALIRQGVDSETAQETVSVPTAVDQGETPNIIVIMNESFSDLSVVGDIETNIPYMPYIDSIKDETIQGNVYVSTIGTGTSNTEFEFLTGNTMAFLPAGSNAYQLYIKGEQPGLASTLMAQHFSADALHPYFASSWNRPAVYEYMGFQSFTTSEDLFGQDLIDKYVSSGYSYSLYKRLLRQKFPGESILLRRYVSDAYDFNKVIEMYEDKDEDQPFFLFNVTMQNHSSYNQQFDNFQQEVWLTSTQGDYPKTDQYLSLIKKTDEAFEELLDYFKTVDEPTIILMFGDHQPFIEDSFYSEVMGQSISEMDDETQQKRYITRFILWANYDIPTGWVDEISMNYLSTLLLQIAGLDMTEYNEYLANLYEKLPVITAMGCRDAEGDFFQADEKNPLEAEISDYRKIQYNNLADLKGRATSVFYLDR
jgi:phosphoglycerol transferase MdoB-like AlkP superfamily enzyme